MAGIDMIRRHTAPAVILAALFQGSLGSKHLDNRGKCRLANVHRHVGVESGHEYVVAPLI